MNTIPYGRHYITDDDINAIIEVLRSDTLTQGPKIAEFEQAFADYIGCDYAVAVSNATAGLHLAVMALGIQPGDKVISTPITFVASVNSVRYCGGEVVFADIDPETYLLDIHKVRQLLEASPKGTYKGIIPVDFAGRAVDLEAFRKLADEYGLWIIEDACHAPGGFFTDSNGKIQKCGNGQFVEFSTFSFHPVKHIACGEGGMVTSNNKELISKIRNLRTHGVQQDPKMKHYDHGGWYYEMQELGYNYRMTDFQAALGSSQLKRAEKGLERRKAIAARYAKAFDNVSFIKRQSGICNGHAYHLYVIETENRKGLYNYLRTNNILVQVHYIPAHLMPYYRDLGWKEDDMPFAEEYYSGCLSLPIYPTLKDEEQTYVINKIMEFFEKK